MMEDRNFKVSRQLSINLSVSMLVKKPARSWLCITRCSKVVEIGVFEEFEVEYVPFGEVVREGLWQ